VSRAIACPRGGDRAGALARLHPRHFVVSAVRFVATGARAVAVRFVAAAEFGLVRAPDDPAPFTAPPSSVATSFFGA
jgi:hypothetical protein